MFPLCALVYFERMALSISRADPSRLTLSFERCGRASVEIVGADVHHNYFEPLTVRFDIVPPW